MDLVDLAPNLVDLVANFLAIFQSVRVSCVNVFEFDPEIIFFETVNCDKNFDSTQSFHNDCSKHSCRQRAANSDVTKASVGRAHLSVECER